MNKEDVSVMKLVSELEGVFHDHVYNVNNQIRYPITFSGNREIRGDGILKVSEDNKEFFYSGRYVFGANKLYIYQAINQLLDELIARDLIDSFKLITLLREYQDEYNEGNGIEEDEDDLEDY